MGRVGGGAWAGGGWGVRRGNLPYKATFGMLIGWPHKRGNTVIIFSAM